MIPFIHEESREEKQVYRERFRRVILKYWVRDFLLEPRDSWLQGSNTWKWSLGWRYTCEHIGGCQSLGFTWHHKARWPIDRMEKNHTHAITRHTWIHKKHCNQAKHSPDESSQSLGILLHSMSGNHWQVIKVGNYRPSWYKEKKRKKTKIESWESKI